MIRFQKLAGLIYMILIMVIYFTFIDVMKEFEEALGKPMASAILMVISITGFLSLMSLMKRSSSGAIHSDENEESGKVDFSLNSPTVPREEATEVKPIDFAGNIFEHNDKTLEDDLSFLQDKDSNED